MIKQKKYDSDFFNSEYFLGTKSNYNLNYFDWERKKDIFRSLAKEFERFKPKRVLDIGCALGFLVQGFNDIGIETYGIDISKWAIKHAKPNCQVVDITKGIPFEDNYFDLVTCFDILEHIPVQFHEFVFSEIARVCKTSLCIQQPFLVMPEQVYGGVPEDDISHVAVMPPYYYILNFLNRGFKLEGINPLPNGHPWDLRLMFSK